MRLGAPLKPLRWALITASLVLAADQLTKWWAEEVLRDSPITLIDGFLDLRYIINTGASFSMLQGAGSLIAVVVIAVIVFVVMLVRRIGHTPEAVALGLILGGGR